MPEFRLPDNTDRSATGIAHAIQKLVSNGSITPGMRLPTVRAVAKELDVSPATVGHAWKHLTEYGVVETRGRLGTFVLEPHAREPWRQFRRVLGADFPQDLSTGFPDPDLFPDLAPFLVQVAAECNFRGYGSAPILPGLLETLRNRVSSRITVANTLLGTHIIGVLAEVLPVIGKFHDAVVVGNPEFAPYLDLVERSGLRPIPVDMDHEGLLLEEVETAISEGAIAVIIQPRVHNPSGISMSIDRLRQIAELCARHDVTIIESEHFGSLGSAPYMSAMEWAPEQTLHVRSFAKDLHPDIRVAVAYGARRIIDLVQRRRVGGFEISGINQELLRLLLNSPEACRAAEERKSEYDRRRTLFIQTLANFGVEVRTVDGLNVWVPVRSEQDALIHLASHGISAAPGSAFQVHTDTPHLRVSIAGMGDSAGEIAELVAIAAQASRMRT